MKQATIEQSTKQRNHAAIGSRIAEMRERVNEPGYVEARLDAAIDRLIESGDLATESTPRCGRCGESMAIAAYRHGDEMVCATCHLLLSDDASAAMEGDRWE